jgi:predicted ATPase
LAESCAHLEAGLALYDPVRDRNSCFVYAFDSRVVCLHWLSQALLVLGYPDQAQARRAEVLAFARELAHPNTAAQALACGCIVPQLLQDRQDAQAQAETLVALATEQGFPLWRSTGEVIRGWTHAYDCQPQRGIAVISQGLADYRATGAEMWSPYFLGMLAEAHGQANQAAAGLSLAADALARVNRTGVCWIEAELHRR